MDTGRGLRLALVAALGFGVATTAWSAVCVDAARGNDASNGACTLAANGRWSAPVRTLGRAFALAPAGSEIWVAAGTYAQDGLVVPEGVTLLGGFAGTESLATQADPAFRIVEIRPASPAQAKTAALWLSNGAVVSGVRATSGNGQAGAAIATSCPPAGGPATYEVRESELYGSQTGLWAPPCEMSAQTVTSRGNRIHHNEKGFGRDSNDQQPYETFTVSFAGDSFFRNSDLGIAVAWPSGTFGSNGVRYSIDDTLLFANGDGIQTDNLQEGGHRIRIANSVVAGSRAYGIFLPADDSGHATLTETTVLRNGRDGMLFFSDSGWDYDVDRSLVRGNGGHGINRGVSSPDGSVTVRGSRILDNGGDGLLLGTSAYTPATILSGNVIAGNRSGIAFGAAFTDAVTFTPTTDERNALSGNRLYCIDDRANDHPLGFENNFFATNVPAEIAACIRGNVDYDPWYWPASGAYLDGTPRQVLSSPRFATYPGRPELRLDRPAPGSRIAVMMSLDAWSSGSRIGSFEGHLRWDPRVLRYARWDLPATSFNVACSATEVDDGILRCTGNSPAGASGVSTPVCVELDVVGPVRWPSVVDVEPTSVVSHGSSQPPFEDLTAILVPEDSYVTVAPNAIFGDVSANERVDAADAAIVLGREVGLPIPNEAAERIEEHLGDANGDGATNSTDANVMLSSEARLTVPKPCGRPNVVQGTCAGAFADAFATGDALRATTPPSMAWLVVDRATIQPGETFNVEVWVSSGKRADLGSYTAELGWDAGNYDIVEVRHGGTRRLSRPTFNRDLGGAGRLPFAAADPKGERLGLLRLVSVTLAARARVGHPVEELRLAFPALAGLSPGFADLLPGLVIGTPVVP